MYLTQLTDLISANLSANEQLWFDNAMSSLQLSTDPINDLLDISVVVKRKIQSINQIENILLTTTEVSDLLRIALLLQVLTSHNELSVSTVVKGYYQAGDSSEKAAILRGLNLIDSKGEAVAIAVRAGRCNSLDEFTALALNNSYASEHFEDLNFNQLVLKTLFLGLHIDTLLGLNKRLSAQLSNMCFSYVVEQALAERVPSATIWLAIRYSDLTSEHENIFVQYVKHFASRDNQHAAAIKSLIVKQSLSFLNEEL
ncbi:EboA domain-containing protein [Paraglaciecola sp. L3A3]|uniref:EboA domain-containing protein n=1 Tax=Paraglaciecola sp. L3A3 TaxID=2686358 RepID=UPI00131B1487|nr:EboA domain-containing protein [Paraglaciecola sp. L3A3]